MGDRDGYIEGVPCWIDTTQPDPDAAVSFYGGLFGWELQDAMPPGSPAKYFIARIRGGQVAAIGQEAEDAENTGAWNTYIWVDSADATAEKVKAAGGSVVMEPFDVMDQGRMAIFTDPEGAAFRVWEARAHRGANVVNEHGALNFNGLATRDPEAAQAFYGSVFGWRTLDLGNFLAWMLPGYAEFLEQREPGLRERMKEGGAPAGFEDVVAAINPIGDDQPDTPPHWNVTFAVDDADATAKKAYELGGEILVPPFDAPWVRMTIVRDPQGAMFIASQFVPENANLASEQPAAGQAAPG
jgi:uncharacterized protein